jgi:hypothetical protein
MSPTTTSAKSEAKLLENNLFFTPRVYQTIITE